MVFWVQTSFSVFMPVPSHGDSCTTKRFFETNCACSQRVFFFECTCGSKVFLDDYDVKHECEGSQERLRKPERIKRITRGELLTANKQITKAQIGRLRGDKDVKPHVDWSKYNGVQARRVVIAHNHPERAKNRVASMDQLWEEYFESLRNYNICANCFKPMNTRPCLDKLRGSFYAEIPAHFRIVTRDGKTLRNTRYRRKIKFEFYPRETMFDQKCNC